MMFHMRLRRFRRMMRRLVLVPIRKMRMVSRYMMLAIFMRSSGGETADRDVK